MDKTDLILLVWSSLREMYTQTKSIFRIKEVNIFVVLS